MAVSAQGDNRACGSGHLCDVVESVDFSCSVFI